VPQSVLLVCIYMCLPALDVGFMQRPDDFKSTLFVARITEWDENMPMPKGLVFLSVISCHDMCPVAVNTAL